MSTRYKGSVLSVSAAGTSTSAAKGIWRSNETMQALQATAWPLLTIPIEFLLVAGGGPGGWNFSGGGGAGGVVSSSALNISPGVSYTVTIGAGGTAPGSGGVPGTGNNSVFTASSSSPALGGGGGDVDSQTNKPGGAGGSGGGAG